jgi:cyclophilin family peptidyl-prolyl cis-trans isomerase
LEQRCLLAAPVLDPVTNATVPGGKTLQIPLTGTDADGDPLAYSVTSSNPQITAQIRTGNPFLRLTVQNFGVLEFELFRDLAPRTVDTIAGLVKSGFYDGLTFHRIEPTFVIQGGDPNGDGTGGPGFRFDDEFNAAAIFSGGGQLAMANSGKDTNGSQFFVTVASPSPQPRFLDFNHTIFGQLVRGFNVLSSIAATPRDTATSRPLTPVVITRAEIVPNTTDAVLTLTATAAGASSTITVTVNDGQNGTATQTFTAQSVTDTANAPPILGSVNDQVTPAGTPISFMLTGSDLENDPLEFQALTLDANPGGSVAVVGNTVTVTPNAGFTGQIRLRVGVKQQGATSRGSTSDPFDTQEIVVAVGDQALTAAGAQVTGSEGAALNVTVATFTHPDLVAGNFTASINWGDGTVSNGTVTLDANNTFIVTGTNTYEESGNYPVRVTITHLLGGSQSSPGARAIVNSTATIADAILTATPLTINTVRGAPLTNIVVATFSDADPSSDAGDFTASINWGDGTTTAGIITAGANNTFNVQGTHTYNATGNFQIGVTITEVNASQDVSPSTVTTTSTAVVAVPMNDVFVDAAYQDLLGRDADAAGMASFTAFLDNGGSRDDVVLRIVNSQERRTNEIQRLYRTHLGRDADAAGLAGYLAALEVQSNGFAGTLEQVQAALLGSDEYFQQQGGGTNDGFLDALFQDVLNRSIDATARSAFTQALAQGASRRQIADTLVGSTEFRQLLVSDFYTQFQRRTVDDNGRSYFVNTALGGGATQEQVMAGIVGSPEYLASQQQSP